MFSQPILCDLAKILEDITGSRRTLPTLGQILAEDELAWPPYEYAHLLLTQCRGQWKGRPDAGRGPRAGHRHGHEPADGADPVQVGDLQGVIFQVRSVTSTHFTGVHSSLNSI